MGDMIYTFVKSFTYRIVRTYFYNFFLYKSISDAPSLLENFIYIITFTIFIIIFIIIIIIIIIIITTTTIF